MPLAVQMHTMEEALRHYVTGTLTRSLWRYWVSLNPNLPTYGQWQIALRPSRNSTPTAHLAIDTDLLVQDLTKSRGQLKTTGHKKEGERDVLTHLAFDSDDLGDTLHSSIGTARGRSLSLRSDLFGEFSGHQMGANFVQKPFGELSADPNW